MDKEHTVEKSSYKKELRPKVAPSPSSLNSETFSTQFDIEELNNTLKKIKVSPDDKLDEEDITKTVVDLSKLSTPLPQLIGNKRSAANSFSTVGTNSTSDSNNSMNSQPESKRVDTESKRVNKFRFGR